MQIAIIGYGNIGQALAQFFKPDNTVVIFDIDKHKLGEAKQSFKILSQLESLDNSYDFIFLCLPTRLNKDNDTWTYDHVFSVVNNLVPQIDENQFVICTATAMPGYSQKVALKFGVRAKNYVYMPLFVREKNVYDDFVAQYPFNGLVFGLHQYMQDYQEIFNQFKTKIETLFAPIYKDRPITNTIYTTYETAEHIKLLDAVNLMMRITTNNAYGAVFKNSDAHKFVQLDERLGAYGFDYGRPFGGYCLPNYLDGLLNYLRAEVKKQSNNKELSLLLELMEIAKQVNDYQK